MLHGPDLDSNQQHPHGGNNDGDPCEYISGTGAERAGSADSPERACEPTALAPLDQHQEDQEEADHQDQGIQDLSPPRDFNFKHSDSLPVGYQPGSLRELSSHYRVRAFQREG